MARKPKEANPYVRSIHEGGLRLASSVAKLPALGHSIANREINLFKKLTGGEQTPIPQELYDNSVTRAIEASIESNSYVLEAFPEDNLVSLLKKGEYGRAGEYIAHQAISNAPQHLILAIAAVSGFGTPALATMGALSASEAAAKGAEKGADPYNVGTNAIVSGVAEAAFERIGTVGIVKNIKSSIMKQYGKKAADETFRGMAKTFGVATLKAGAGEGLEEAATSVVQGTSENLTGVDQNSFSDILSDSFESAVIGAVSGGAFSTPTAGFSTVKERGTRDAIKRFVNNNGGEYEGSSGNPVDPKDQTVHFKDAKGESQTMKRTDMSLKGLLDKIDPELGTSEKYIDENLAYLDERLTFENTIQINEYQEELGKIADDLYKNVKGNKVKKRKSLDAILYRVVDFMENPDILTKPIEIVDKKTGEKTTTSVYAQLSESEKALYEQAQILYKDMQSGKADPRINKLVTKITDELSKRGEEYMAGGIINKVRKLYVPHVLKTEDFDKDAKNKTRQDKTKSANARQHDTLAEAMIHEGKPVARDGLTTNFINYVDSHDQKLALHVMKEKMIKEGLVVREDQIPKGQESEYVDVFPDDNTFTHPEKTGRKVRNEAGVMEAEVVYKRYKAKKRIARSLNVVFQDTLLRKNKTLQAIRKVNALSKASRLLYSFFHFNAFSLGYMLSAPYRFHDIKENVKKGDYKEAAWNVNDMVNPFAGFQAYKDGLKAWAEGDEALRVLVRNGLTLGRNQEWDEMLLRESTGLSKLMDKYKISKAIKDGAVKSHEQFGNLLFQKVGAGLKAKTAMLMLEAHKRKFPNKPLDVLAREVAENVNDNFGGLHLKRMRRNPTAQYIWQMFAFAPDWTESNFNLYIKGLTTNEETKKQLYRSTATRILTKGFIATALLSLLSAAIREPDEDERERKQTLVDNFVKNYSEAWQDGKLGWMKTNVTPFLKKFGMNPQDRYYYSFLSFFLDPTKWISRDIKKGEKGSYALQQFFTPERIVTSLGKSAYYKSAAVPQIIGDFILDTDYTFYRDFNSVGEMFNKKALAEWRKSTLKPERLLVSPEQVPAFAAYEARKFVPIPIVNSISFFLGEMEGSEYAMSMAGQDIKRAYAKV